MFYNLNEIENREDFSDYDVCVAGTGPAGITVAIKLEQAGNRVALLEAGDITPTQKSQEASQGNSAGSVEYWGIQCRSRYFGGSSNCWSGMTRILSEYDLGDRNYNGIPGWPISSDDLNQYWKEALSILDADANEFITELPGWQSESFIADSWYESPPTKFATKYGDRIKQSDLIDCFFNANVTNVDLHENSSGVSNFTAKNLQNKDFRFFADQFVLACGGLENPRILLNSNQQIDTGVGNQSDYVGRCFMDSLNVNFGRFVGNRKYWTSNTRKDFYSTTTFLGKNDIGGGNLSLGTAAQPPLYGRTKELKRLLRDNICKSGFLREKSRLLTDFDCPGDGTTSSMLEQSPNRNSRIVLGKDRDSYGVPQLEVQWDHEIEIPVGHHCHHMGTTRMASNKRDGVVDENCCVFGTDNLYMAGSSVFSASGGKNPTGTIVVLSLRLADYLTNKMKA